MSPALNRSSALQRFECSISTRDCHKCSECSLCVEWGSTNTNWHINLYYVKISTHTWSVKLKHNGIWGWGIYGLNGWGIYGLNGWGSYGKASYRFLWDMLKNNTGLQGSTLSGHRMIMGFGPFELPTRDKTMCQTHITNVRHRLCGKIHQALSLQFCILQVIKNWSQERPGNDTT